MVLHGLSVNNTLVIYETNSVTRNHTISLRLNNKERYLKLQP